MAKLSQDTDIITDAAVFREMPCFVTVQDRDKRFVQTNRLFEEHFGSCEGEHCWAVFKQRVGPCRSCIVEQTISSGEAQQGQETVITADGREIPLMVYTSPLRDATGQVTRVVRVSADISEMKRLQKKLHRTQQRSRQFFDEAPCYVSVQDRELNITAANRLFKEHFGDEIGMKCYEVYKHRDEPCLTCPVLQTFEKGTPQTSEEVVTSISGEQHNVLVHTAPIRNPDGEITQVMEMSTNITQIRQLEDQLSSLGLLIGSVSHGIKGLLTAIDGGIYLVNSGMPKNNQQRVDEGWSIVQRNIRRVRSMVLDILYYAKDRQLDYESLNALELAADVSNLVNHKAEELAVRFHHDFQVDVGEFEADRAALRTALVNILENAFDACRVDGGKCHHRVSFTMKSSDDNNSVVFEVEDNGIGMDRETAEKMFTLFFSSKGSEGTGLGMFVSNKIVRQHAGRIDVSSQLSRGTRLSVEIPRRRKASSPA
jgi:PAS domain S-box-containing protein